MNEVLCAQELSKIYTEAGDKIFVLDKVNLSIQSGEMIGILGESGAGKTTLLQLLGGLDLPTAGKVLISGQSFTNMSATKKGYIRNRNLGFVYQFHHLLPEFNSLENVYMPLLIRGLKLKTAVEKAIHYIEKVGLLARINHRIGELSGGERQRIAIARALVGEPKCVLADEPTGNLDEHTAGEMLELLLSLNQSLKISFVIVTHNKSLARNMHRVLNLANAKLEPYDVS